MGNKSVYNNNDINNSINNNNDNWQIFDKDWILCDFLIIC